MEIVVFRGSPKKGNTFHATNIFMDELSKCGDVHFTEFILPDALPVFCTGCKACFFKDMSACPHKEYTVPIWDSIRQADLLVFSSPSYVLGATGQIKALLDHFGTKWMAHSPEREMFFKQAVIITNAAGAGMKNTIKTIGNSLDFWGVARRYAVKQALFYTDDWKNVPEKRKIKIKKQCEKIAKKIKKPAKKPRFKIRFLFFIMRIAQKMIHKKLVKDKMPNPTVDYLYWQQNGYFKRKPWK